MQRKKIIFMGSKPIGFECLKYLIAKKDELGVDVAGVLTNSRKEFGNEHDLNILANEAGIPILESLNELPECDIIYSVQYHKILKQEHIDKAAQIAVNLHMAPLPEYRGSNQFSFAIIDQKEEFGTTIHQIDSRIDHGDILFQKRFRIPAKCWVHELYQLTCNASLNLFRQTLSHIITGNYKPVAQQLLEGKYGSSLHYRKEMGDIKILDLDWEKEKIERYIRATTMPGFEPPYFMLDGRKIHIDIK